MTTNNADTERRKKIFISIRRATPVLIAGALLAVAPVAAHMGATGVVKERMELMSKLGDSMKMLNAMMRGSIPIDAAAVSRSAETIRDHSARIPSLFPAGSYAHPSEASPAIDENRAGFEALARQLGARANALGILAGDPDPSTLAKWFRETGRVCSDCHKDFRAKR